MHKAHTFCAEGCFTAVLHDETGRTAAGMRPFGLFGDRTKIRRVIAKYSRAASDAITGEKG